MTDNSLRYLTDHYDKKIARIKRIDAPLNFIFITDQHNDAISSVVPAVESMRYILERCPEIKFIVSGGDIGNDYNPDPAGMRESHRRILEAMYGLGIPVHCVLGNHDDGLGNMIDHHWDTRNCILPKEMHELCGRYNPTENNYYYTDVDTEGGGYRFIFLDCTDKPYLTDENGQYPFGWRLEISNKQACWFEQALDTDRWIFVFNHSPLSNAGIWGTEGRPDGIKPYDDLLNGPRINYHAKQCKKVLALFAGHVHYDNIRYDGDLPQITTLCAMLQDWEPGMTPERIPGTITETAFDVVSVVRDTMYLTRFGAGYDRSVDLIRARSSNHNKTYFNG